LIAKPLPTSDTFKINSVIITCVCPWCSQTSRPLRSRGTGWCSQAKGLMCWKTNCKTILYYHQEVGTSNHYIDHFTRQHVSPNLESANVSTDPANDPKMYLPIRKMYLPIRKCIYRSSKCIYRSPNHESANDPSIPYHAPGCWEPVVLEIWSLHGIAVQSLLAEQC
jgi:hypothetical protein